MVQAKDISRYRVVIISTIAIAAILALVILLAVFSPLPPEAVVSQMLRGIAQHDYQQVEALTADVAQQGLSTAVEEDGVSQWRNFWENGEEWFNEIRVGEVHRLDDQASVLVYYGPGLLHYDVFLLRLDERQWKVVDIENGDD